MDKLDTFNANKKAYDYACSIIPNVKNLYLPIIERFHLNTFMYARYNLDDLSICNTMNGFFTHLESLHWYYFQSVDNGVEFPKAIRKVDLNSIGFFFWNSQKDPIMKALKEQFGLTTAITIYKRHASFVDAWSFVGDSNTDLNTVTLSQLEELQRFSQFFSKNLNKHIDTKEFFGPTTRRIFLNDIDMKAINPSNQENTPFIQKASLSSQQTRCLELIGQGLSIKQIANQLGISTHTVETHVNNLKIKLGAPYKTDLIQLYRQGIGLAL